MSLLYDPQLNGELDANGGERLKKIDAGFFQGTGQGVATGIENAGTSLARIAANVGNAQMRVSGAQMIAGAALAGSQETFEAGKESLEAKPPSESQLPQYKSFDSDQIGTVGTILGGLAQQTPSLAAMVLNPVAGAVLAAAQGQTEAHAEGAKLGLTGSALEDYGGVGALTGGVGAAIPGFAGFGRGAMLYGSRFVLGGLANSATGEADRWGRSAILDKAGFHDQARQMRQADAASLTTEFVLGGLFGWLGGHRKETPDAALTIRPEGVHEDAATAHLLHDNYVTESAPGLAVNAGSEAAHVRAMDSANESIHSGKAVDVSDHINENSTFLAHSGMEEPAVSRQELAGDATQRIDRIAQASDEQAIPQPQTQEPQPGVLSDVHSDPFAALREQAEAIRESHPELSETLNQHLSETEAAHKLAHQESQIYDVAATCALKYGS
ncbi:hypothetical protein [Pantoea vagans]|uniref:hypothetical protein n=1 Tax=Pantoea vagans TaxID=470934 RepID=UPI0032083AF4